MCQMAILTRLIFFVFILPLSSYADIMPRGYSRCNHPKCTRASRMVVRDKYSNHPYRQRMCKDSDEDDSDGNDGSEDFAKSGVLISLNTNLPTSAAVSIGYEVAAMAPVHVSPAFIPRDGPPSKKVRRAREFELKRLRLLKEATVE